MNKTKRAWSVVSTLFIFLVIGGMFIFAALWFITPILQLTTDWTWVHKTVALFWELGLYK